MITNVVRKTFRSLIAFLVLTFFFGSGATSLWAKEFPCSFKLTILYMNDTHGHYSPEKDSNGLLTGGFAKAMTVIDKIRKANDAAVSNGRTDARRRSVSRRIGTSSYWWPPTPRVKVLTCNGPI